MFDTNRRCILNLRQVISNATLPSTKRLSIFVCCNAEFLEIIANNVSDVMWLLCNARVYISYGISISLVQIKSRWRKICNFLINTSFQKSLISRKHSGDRGLKCLCLCSPWNFGSNGIWYDYILMTSVFDSGSLRIHGKWTEMVKTKKCFCKPWQKFHNKSFEVTIYRNPLFIVT